MKVMMKNGVIKESSFKDRLPELEGEMKRIAKENLPLKVNWLSKEDARNRVKERNESYQPEFFDERSDKEMIAFARYGEYEAFSMD